MRAGEAGRLALRSALTALPPAARRAVRIDSTLLAMNGLTWERGSQSLVIWGSEMPRPGASYVLDNVDKTAADARSVPPAPVRVRRVTTQIPSPYSAPR